METRCFPDTCRACKMLIWLVTACMSIGLTSLCFAGQESPEVLTVIYLKNGRQIECELGWIEGETLVYRKFGGNLSMPLSDVDIENTFAKSIEREKEKIILQYPGPVYEHEGVLVTDLTVTREIEQRVMSNNWGNRYYVEQGKNQYEVGCVVKNTGEPCRLSVELVALDERGYVLGGAQWISDAIMWEEECAVLKTKFSMRDGAKEEIKTVKINKISRTDSIRQFDERKKQNPTAQSISPSNKSKGKGEPLSPNASERASGEGGRF